MSDTQQIEIIGSYTWLSLQKYLLMQVYDGGSIQLLSFFSNVYVETSLLQSSFIFLAIKIIYLLLQVILSLNKLLMF